MSTTFPHLDDTDIQLLSLLQQDASPSNQALADRLGLSPATCHRRVKRLKDEGYIEGQVAILSPQKMADALGWGLSALVEISLDVQTQEALDAFEQRAQAEGLIEFMLGDLRKKLEPLDAIKTLRNAGYSLAVAHAKD